MEKCQIFHPFQNSISQLEIYNLTTSHRSAKQHILVNTSALQVGHLWAMLMQCVWFRFLFPPFACDDMVSDGESWCSAPYNSIWDGAVIPNRDWWALWLGTVVIALRVAVWHRGTGGWQWHHQLSPSHPSPPLPVVIFPSYPSSSPPPFLPLTWPTSPLTNQIPFSSPLHSQALASLLFIHPRPPAVCPPFWAFTQLLENSAAGALCVHLFA